MTSDTLPIMQHIADGEASLASETVGGLAVRDMVLRARALTPAPPVDTGSPRGVPHIGYAKIPRLFRECVITEKIDGTNAVIYVPEDPAEPLLFGSRSRWLVRGEKDNHGFCAWACGHEEELRTLGPGHHYGEWWGAGIQRGYGLAEKRLSLFRAPPGALPACCYVVPVMYVGPFSTIVVDEQLCHLTEHGSMAAPGYMNPEGVVVFHSASRKLFKATLGDDDAKGKQDPA